MQKLEINDIASHQFEMLKSIEIKSIIISLLGIPAYFICYKILTFSNHPLITFIASLISGLVGIYISTLWLKNSPFSKYRIYLHSAYILRCLIGIIFYLMVFDSTYFSGTGEYKNNNYEYYLTYDNAVHAAEEMRKYSVYLPSDIFPDDIFFKNRNIHTWMGLFLWSGNSFNSMDLAPFNAFHHILAGLVLSIICITLKFESKVAIWAGLLVAFIPWAFPASIMWRDSIGLFAVILSMYFLIKALQTNNFLYSFILFIPAYFLASSDRYIYGLLALLLFIYFYQQKMFNSKKIDIVIICLIIVFLIVFSDFIQYAFLFLYDENIVSSILQKIVIVPLQLLRAIIGPFPWTDDFWGYRMFDHLFHVFQLSMIIAFFINLRYIKTNNYLIIFFLSFFSVAIFAEGVHTAYLAVSLPFLIPMSYTNSINFMKYTLVSLTVFVLLNLIYLISGLHGSGIILKTTGY